MIDIDDWYWWLRIINMILLMVSYEYILRIVASLCGKWGTRKERNDYEMPEIPCIYTRERDKIYIKYVYIRLNVVFQIGNELYDCVQNSWFQVSTKIMLITDRSINSDHKLAAWVPFPIHHHYVYET